MEDIKIKGLWEEFHVPKNIRRHMEKVAEVAVRLGKKLLDRKVIIDLKLLKQAALLHDLAKIIVCYDDLHTFEDNVKIEDIEVWNRLRSLYIGMKDPEITAKVLRDLNEPKLAEIVRKHHFTSVLKADETPVTWEEKVLYYADKLVIHDKEVQLKTRLRDMDIRYSSGKEIPPYIKEAKKKARDIEKEIEAKLSC